MKNTLLSVVCAAGALCASVMAPVALSAQEANEPALMVQDAGALTLEDFKWENRIILVFADSPLDPNFSEQLALLETRPEVLLERDIVVLTDTDPEARAPLRLKLRPRGFALVIVDKDARVMLRKPRPWDLREISHAIDKTPLRQQEIREAKSATPTGG